MEPKKLIEICRNWKQGTCELGMQCHYRHELSVPRTPEEQKDRRKSLMDLCEAEARNTAEFEVASKINTGAPIQNFDKLSSVTAPLGPITIKDCEFVASYNWNNAAQPTIFVPGSPARVRQSTRLPLKVVVDQEQEKERENSHETPSAPFDAFFKALLTMNPNFDLGNIELVTDCDCLLKLLNCALGCFYRANEQEVGWRIDVDLVGNTMFLYPWVVDSLRRTEIRQRDKILKKLFLHYDHGMKDSTSHQRIVRYKMGGIECLVQFEVDGYQFKVDGDIDHGRSLEPPQTFLSLSDDDSSHVEVQVMEHGTPIDNDSHFKLHIRRSKAQMPDDRALSQAWISQSRHLLVARYNHHRVLTQPQRIDLVDHLQAWEKKNEDILKGLVTFIGYVKEIAKGQEGGKCCLVCLGNEMSVVKMYGRVGEGLRLPDGVRERFCG